MKEEQSQDLDVKERLYVQYFHKIRTCVPKSACTVKGYTSHL